MTRPDPLDPKNYRTTRYQISADELAARMQRMNDIKVTPLKKAVFLMEQALSKVLETLGVDTTLTGEQVKAQQEVLGITIWEHEDERAPQINGFFVHINYERFTPFAWVGNARLDVNGECYCDIQWFQTNKLTRKSVGKILRHK
jgi:hypothetical protein